MVEAHIKGIYIIVVEKVSVNTVSLSSIWKIVF